MLLFAFKVTPLYVISWPAVFLNALTLRVALPLSTAVHEAAHALVAHAIGFSLLRVRLGYGPIIWSRYIGFTKVEIRRIPLSGDVWVAAPSTRWLRARLMATAAAGPLSNAVVLAASVGDSAMRTAHQTQPCVGYRRLYSPWSTPSCS